MRDSPSTRYSLVARLRDPRDEQAWAEFVEIYHPLVRRLAKQAGLQEADIDDLTQEVFRSVATAIGGWDPDPERGSFRGWLFRIAKNLIINLLESRKRGPVGSGDTRVERLLEDQAAAESESSALFDGEYRYQLFRWAVDRIQGEFHETTWQAFWRTAIDNQAPAEVAEALGITRGSVYVYRNRVMVRLRKMIEEVEGD